MNENTKFFNTLKGDDLAFFKFTTGSITNNEILQKVSDFILEIAHDENYHPFSLWVTSLGTEHSTPEQEKN
jgi:hypothetical protein